MAPATIPNSIGPYRIDRLLGQGGMGEVFLAHDPRLERKVAIKVIGDHFLRSENAQRRFLREARLIASLNHPAIVQIHDVQSMDGKLCIVMEFISGLTLARIINSSRLTTGQTFKLALDIAQGMKAAHQEGILHRDLKAENIKITETDQVKILDFGLARHIDSGNQDSEDRLCPSGKHE